MNNWGTKHPIKYNIDNRILAPAKNFKLDWTGFRQCVIFAKGIIMPMSSMHLYGLQSMANQARGLSESMSIISDDRGDNLISGLPGDEIMMTEVDVQLLPEEESFSKGIYQQWKLVVVLDSGHYLKIKGWCQMLPKV